MLPHEAAGIWTPIPRKLREDSNIIAEAIRNVMEIKIGAIALGRMYRVMITLSRWPMAFPPSTESFSLTDRTVP